MSLLIIVLTNAVLAFAPGEADQILAQLSKIRLDKKQIYNIRDITIRRDALSIAFNRGTIAFLEPVMGKVTGAVFIGSGEIVTIPPDSIEKQQMNRFTGSPMLNELFRAALFRFTDDTYEEILKEYREHAEEELAPEDAGQFLPWDATLSERSGWLNYRLMADLLGSKGGPLFLGELNGENLGWFHVTYDPRLFEELVVLKVFDTPDPTAADIWSSFHRRGEVRNVEAAAHENKLPIDILAYDIDATISENARLEAKATMRAKALWEGERVLNFDLSRFLRVSNVSTESGEMVPFYQHEGVNALVVVLPQPQGAGQDIVLTFAYSGDAIEKRGTIFHVGPRGPWYPKLGFQDRALFNLTFQYPGNYALAATGTKLKEWDEAGLRHSTWKSEREFAVAGFNLGTFTILSDEGGPVPVDVCVNNEVEIAKSVLTETRATTAYFSEVFGPYPYKRLTVCQLPGDFSQSWPSLVGGQQRELARSSAIARQWFGNKVGWASYRDQWITEAFANYGAAMYIENKYPGSPRLREILDDARQRLLERVFNGGPMESLGPIWLGHRLASAATPNAYDETVSNKSAWVVHMLRMLMREDGKNSDDAFLKMIGDFLQTFDGQLASTQDLKRIAEKYMTPAMDLHGDKKLDWFFDQWVFGTGIPTFNLEYKVETASNGFVISGRIVQKNAPDTFTMPVPLYADEEFLGRVHVTDDNGSFRFIVAKRPARVLLDPHDTLLKTSQSDQRQ